MTATQPSPASTPAFEARLAAAWPPGEWADVTVVLAVSGGADSVALLRAMTALKAAGEGRLVAAHLNHRLRGTQSDEDEAFVVELCRRLQVACEAGRLGPDELPAAPRAGLEAAARKARYRFLAEVASRRGARFVATAHTADDQAETILHRIIRGTGIRGLSGMARSRPLGPATLCRPMLAIRRGEVLAYLEGLGQAHRPDATNEDSRFTRNRIRNELLPRLAARYNPSVVDALLRLGRLAGDVQRVVDESVETMLAERVTREGTAGVRIDAAGLGHEPPYLLGEMLAALWQEAGWPLQAMGYCQWQRLSRMLAAAAAPGGPLPARATFPGNVLAEPQPGFLRLRRKGPAQ
jgi:tRNA(Ile)-lysidine synthase